MKILLGPAVNVVGVTEFIDHPVYQIPDDGCDADRLGAFAAKGCYDSYGETGRSNVANQEAVIDSMHGSVLEHFHISFFIEGITRGLSLELNRHRPFNISQRSTRYTKEEDSSIVLDPYYASIYRKYKSVIRQLDSAWVPIVGTLEDPVENAEYNLILEFLNSSSESIDAYSTQVERLINLNPNKLTGFDLRKWARGKARNLLPHGLETRGTWTNNLRGLRWFVEVRSERHAEPEIRVLANEIFLRCRKIAPTHFADFENIGTYDGIPEWATTHHKI
jgi:thymidylate synthase (FAD)